MPIPVDILNTAERLDKTIKDWGERPNHWVVRFTDGTVFQILKSDPRIAEQISGLQPKLERGKRRRAGM